MLRRVLAATIPGVLALFAFAFAPPLARPAAAADDGPSAAEGSKIGRAHV